jgi:hypothetical protein
MSKKFKLLVVMGLLLVFATSAQAVLFRVGPSDVPSPPGNGYPLWYQDTVGFALDLCIPQTLAQLDACLVAPVPGDPDPTLPFVFPTNWLDEFFWYGADAVLNFDTTNTNSALLVQALEAAFGGGPPAVGDQIVFGRIRIRIDAPVDGTYTVTYPYGEQEFSDVTAGGGAINVTSDIGIGSPGDFTGALNSAIGPFLTPTVDANGTPVESPINIDGDLFLTDGVTETEVTGSPFGNNFFRVCVDGSSGLGLDKSEFIVGVNDCMETRLFTVFGKVHQGAIASPFTVDRATYARSAGSARVDVFANASPGPGAGTPSLSLGDAAGISMPSVLMNGPTTDMGQFYGQSIPFDANAIPAAVIVTNVADIPPSSLTQVLVDEVTISQANFNATDQTLTITAASSDELVPPQLFAIGLPGSLTGSDELTTTLGAGARQGTFPKPLFPPSTGGPVPPLAVTVLSSAGGQDTEFVTTTAGGTFAAGAPVAIDDIVSVEAGTTPVGIDVLLNDVDYDATTVQILSTPANGTAIVDTSTPSTTVTYTQVNNAFVGDDTFTYTVMSVGGLESNVATVTVTTTAPAGGVAPIAVDDTATADIDTPIVIFVLANDTDQDSTIDPATVSILTPPSNGTATLNIAGEVEYTPATVTGTDTFTYTVQDEEGNISNVALVTVTVNDPAPPEVITVQRAQFRNNQDEWRVDGTTTVPIVSDSPNLIDVHVGIDIGGALVGTVEVDALGTWRLRPGNPGIVLGEATTITVHSSGGTVVTAPLQVR